VYVCVCAHAHQAEWSKRASRGTWGEGGDHVTESHTNVAATTTTPGGALHAPSAREPCCMHPHLHEVHGQVLGFRADPNPNPYPAPPA